MTVPAIHLSYDAGLDWLMAYEFGRTDDYHLPGAWRGVTDEFGYMRDAPDGAEVGFKVIGFSALDPEAEELAEIWEGPRFDVPALGLTGATAGEICVAAVPVLGGESTLNRRLFAAAAAASGEEAVALWRDCLQAGDPMAHYGLGYTLLSLHRPREAYRHLRAYTEIVPANPWAWCYLGRACHELGEAAEAERAYERALGLEREEEPTDAAELLGALRAGESPQSVTGYIEETPFDSADYLAGLELPPPPAAAPQEDGGTPVALFLAGGPLSGKTTVLELLDEEDDPLVPPDFVHVDPRAIREHLPEWRAGRADGDPDAARYVAAEVGDIARQLVEEAVAERRHVVIDGLGAGEPRAFAARLLTLHDAGYAVRVLLVDTPTENALARNEARAEQTGVRLDPDLLRTLHARVAQRFEEWRALPFVEFEIYTTE